MTVPLYDELDHGALRAILRTAEIGTEEFLESNETNNNVAGECRPQFQ